jgi:hypothetical protein
MLKVREGHLHKIAFAVLTMAATLAAAQIPPGTTVRVRLGQTISSETAKSGDAWEGTLASNVVANGKVLVKRGAPVRGRVVEAKESGRLTDPGVLKLRVTSIGGKPVKTSMAIRRGQSHKKRNIAAIGGGAAVGAAIGAIAGGGKGAAIGAGTGAGAGTAGAAATGKRDVKLPVETVVAFTVR